MGKIYFHHAELIVERFIRKSRWRYWSTKQLASSSIKNKYGKIYLINVTHGQRLVKFNAIKFNNCMLNTLKTLLSINISTIIDIKKYHSLDRKTSYSLNPKHYSTKYWKHIACMICYFLILVFIFIIVRFKGR